MKENYTHITMVLDKSGSMERLRNDVTGGFNSFIEAQTKLPGEATFTLVLFDTVYDVRLNGVPIREVPLLDRTSYMPNGSTALHDAVGRAIRETGLFLRDLPEEKRPSKVIFVIQTDGEENASHETSLLQVQEMRKLQEEKYKWQFVFLGVGIDAFLAGRQYGINKESTARVGATGQNVMRVYDALNRNLAEVRCGGAVALHFSDADRSAMDDANTIPVDAAAEALAKKLAKADPGIQFVEKSKSGKY